MHGSRSVLKKSLRNWGMECLMWHHWKESFLKLHGYKTYVNGSFLSVLPFRFVELNVLWYFTVAQICLNWYFNGIKNDKENEKPNVGLHLVSLCCRPTCVLMRRFRTLVQSVRQPFLGYVELVNPWTLVNNWWQKNIFF